MPSASKEKRKKLGVNDGARTRDISDHNRMLYQLSYAHHEVPILPVFFTGLLILLYLE